MKNTTWSECVVLLCILSFLAYLIIDTVSRYIEFEEQRAAQVLPGG